MLLILIDPVFFLAFFMPSPAPPRARHNADLAAAQPNSNLCSTMVQMTAADQAIVKAIP